MASKYSPIIETLISTPLVNLASWTVAAKAGQIAPVVVGTDDWEVPLFGDTGWFPGVMCGQGLTSAANNVVFNVADIPRIKSLAVQCNFADGLLDVSNKTLNTPPVVGVAFPAGGVICTQNMTLALDVFRLDATAPYGKYRASTTSQYFIVSGFGLPLDCDFPVPRSAAGGIIAPVSDKGYVLELTLAPPIGARNLFSTISIDPAFQGKRILVWAEMVVEHTFPLTFRPA